MKSINPFVFFIALLFSSSAAYAVGLSFAFLEDRSDYIVARSSEWQISSGHLIWQDNKSPHGKHDDYFSPHQGEHLLTIDFSNEGVSEARAIYSYYTFPDYIKAGECVFEFQTIDNKWAPSFLNSHCTGPIHLSTRHWLGGVTEDYYTFVLT